MPEFIYRSHISAPREELFAWHARPGSFERLIPPWQRIEWVGKKGGITDGSRLTFALKQGPLKIRWTALHRDYRENTSFTDEQVEGPFAQWVHFHNFLPDGYQRSILEDQVIYELPLHPVSHSMMGSRVESEIDRMFRFRHERTMNDIQRHQLFADRPKLKVAITGASGLIGAHLTAFLQTGGHGVFRLVRKKSDNPLEIFWNPSTGDIDANALEGMDAVVHLAGENIAGRWTAAKKERILRSRVDGTRLLSETLTKLTHPPQVLISASAIGYYGHRGSDTLTEEDLPGRNFLSDVCRQWEAAAQPAQQAGIRVVNFRIGVVLSASGGVLAQMKTPFTLGLGGVVGDGKQYMSWIALDDLIGVIHFLLYQGDVSGPVNAASPNPVSNREFTQTLGAVLHRPTLIPLPAFVVKALFAEMGEELLLASTRVKPARLEEMGFSFLYPQLQDALRFELGK